MGIGEGPDEIAHLDHVFFRFTRPGAYNYVARGLTEPGMASIGQGHQPPFYYWFCAQVLRPFISPAEIAPFFDYQAGLYYSAAGVLMGGSSNCHFRQSTHYPTAADRPVVRAINLLRAMNALLLSISVFIVYIIGRMVYPKRPSLALGMAAFHAGIPTALWRSTFVTNDNLVSLIGTVVFLICIVYLKRPRQGFLTLSVATALAAIAFATKYTGIAALGMILFTLLVDSRLTPVRRAALMCVVSAAAFILVLPILLANYYTDHDILLITAVIREFPYLHIPNSLMTMICDLRFIWSVISRMWISIHNLGSLDTGFPPWKMHVWTCLLPCVLFGVLYHMLSGQTQCVRERRTLVVSILSMLGALAVVLQFGTVFPIPEGRYIHVAIAPLCIIVVVGISTCLSLFLRRRAADAATTTLCLFLAAFGSVTTFNYQVDKYYHCMSPESGDVEAGADFGAGDLDGDRIDELFIFYRHPARLFLAKYDGKTFRIEPKWTRAIGLQGDTPEIHDVNADGIGDVTLWRPSAQAVYILDGKSIIGHDETLSPYSDRANKVYSVTFPQPLSYQSSLLVGPVDSDPGLEIVAYNSPVAAWFIREGTSDFNHFPFTPTQALRFGGAFKKAFLFPYYSYTFLAAYDRFGGKFHLGSHEQKSYRLTINVPTDANMIVADIDRDLVGDIITWHHGDECLDIRFFKSPQMVFPNSQFLTEDTTKKCLFLDGREFHLTEEFKVFVISLAQDMPLRLAVADKRTGEIVIFPLMTESGIVMRPLKFDPGFLVPTERAKPFQPPRAER